MSSISCRPARRSAMPGGHWRGLSLLLTLVASVAVGASPGVGISLAEAVKNRDAVATEALLKRHADVNVSTADGSTALHWAAHWDDLATVERLILAGAN